MTASMFEPEARDLFELADRLIARATPGEQIEVVLARGSSTSVKVYGGQVESLTSADSTGAGVRVITEGRVGFAHCGTLDPNVLDDMLSEARDNAEFGEADQFNGLAQPDGVAIVANDSWSERVLEFPVDDKIAMALDLEKRVLAADERIVSSRSTTYGDGWGQSVIVSTAGIRGADRSSSCAVSTQPLAHQGDETQIGVGYQVGRDPSALDVEAASDEAVERATRLLGAVKPPSGRMTILLEPRLALTLLGIVAGMFSGDSVLRGRSPFADRLGEQIASPLLSLTDDPTRSESIASTELDGEGLACRPNPLIVDGVLDRFLYDSYSGRRSGAGSTGSAVRSTRGLPSVGVQLLVMEPGTRSFADLVSSIDKGLYVNSFSGLHSGVNPVSGDFSVGADGLMIRNGAIAEPVRELTVASTIQRLLSDISEVGGDFQWERSGDGGCSLVIEDVSISGS
ncbi:MAG: TldD/PmbA family protein [Microthrixaceae bacterium]